MQISKTELINRIISEITAYNDVDLAELAGDILDCEVSALGDGQFEVKE